MEYDKITVTADGEHIGGWQDGTTAARILWMAAGQVNGRWVNRESSAIALLYTLTGSTTRPLVGAELLPAVTVEDLKAAIAPGNRDVVQVQAEVTTQRCTCADDALYTVKVESSGGTTVHGPMPRADAQSNVGDYRAENPGAEVTMEPCRNPDYRPDCLRDILEDEAYVRYLRAGRNPWHGQAYCQRCGIALWGNA
jgi:hypothetical protein